jgi:hypothetical protein
MLTVLFDGHCSGRCSGGLPSSGNYSYTVLDPNYLLKMASRRNRSNVQQDFEQELTEKRHGKKLSRGTNYGHFKYDPSLTSISGNRNNLLIFEAVIFTSQMKKSNSNYDVSTLSYSLLQFIK